MRQLILWLLLLHACSLHSCNVASAPSKRKVVAEMSVLSKLPVCTCLMLLCCVNRPSRVHTSLRTFSQRRICALMCSNQVGKNESPKTQHRQHSTEAIRSLETSDMSDSFVAKPRDPKRICVRRVTPVKTKATPRTCRRYTRNAHIKSPHHIRVSRLSFSTIFPQSAHNAKKKK
jgi:hypothetical protein